MSKPGGQPNTKADEGGQRPAKAPKSGGGAAGGSSSASTSKTSAPAPRKKSGQG